MSQPSYIYGKHEQAGTWIRFGTGPRTLLVLEDLRTDHKPIAGLALQGLGQTWADWTGTFTVTVLTLPQKLPELSTVGDLAQGLVGFIKDSFDAPVEILAQGISVPLALEAARCEPGILRHLWLVSGAPVLSSTGKNLFVSLLDHGRRHHWARVHGLLAGTMFTSWPGKILGGLLAAAFHKDLGAPADPWDFLVVLQALLAWEPEPEEISVPLNIWMGLDDPLFDSGDWDTWLEFSPNAVLEARKGAHGLLKSRFSEILAGIASTETAFH